MQERVPAINRLSSNAPEQGNAWHVLPYEALLRGAIANASFLKIASPRLAQVRTGESGPTYLVSGLIGHGQLNLECCMRHTHLHFRWPKGSSQEVGMPLVGQLMPVDPSL